MSDRMPVLSTHLALSASNLMPISFDVWCWHLALSASNHQPISIVDSLINLVEPTKFLLSGLNVIDKLTKGVWIFPISVPFQKKLQISPRLSQWLKLPSTISIQLITRYCQLVHTSLTVTLTLCLIETWQWHSEYYQFNEASPSGYAYIDQPCLCSHGGWYHP